MDKCIFTTRFKACCKEKGYTQQDVADKLNISINGLKHHLRSNNPHFPPLDLIIKMAEIFDVDVGYLIGDIDCKRYSMQRISDITPFKEPTISMISKQSDKYCLSFCWFIANIAKSTNITTLTDLFNDYSFLALDDATITIDRDNQKTYYRYAPAKKEALKAKILSEFDNILEELSPRFRLNCDEKKSCEMCINLLDMIDNELRFTSHEILCNKIERYLKEIESINYTEYILLYSPKQIIDKRYLLKEKYHKLYEHYK